MSLREETVEVNTEAFWLALRGERPDTVRCESGRRTAST